MTSRSTSPATPELWTIGYGAWPAPSRAPKMVDALLARGITRLVDVRISPCSSDLDPSSRYGPKPWNLQAQGHGIASLMRAAGLAYEWLVELGNPQRHDPAMTMLRSHLDDEAGGWPVHRGLEILAARVRQPGERIAILCACEDGLRCHRGVVARALSDRHFDGSLAVFEVRTGLPLFG